MQRIKRLEEQAAQDPVRGRSTTIRDRGSWLGKQPHAAQIELGPTQEPVRGRSPTVRDRGSWLEGQASQVPVRRSSPSTSGSRPSKP